VKTAGWSVGVDRDQAKEPPSPLPPPPNLYPSLTPVPQCVAEIRAIGQSPIHCHPEYFKVKPSSLNKKSLPHQRFTFPSLALFPQLSMRPSPSGQLFCLHTRAGRSREREPGSFWKFPKFPYFHLMRCGLGSDSAVL